MRHMERLGLPYPIFISSEVSLWSLFSLRSDPLIGIVPVLTSDILHYQYSQSTLLVIRLDPRHLLNGGNRAM